MDIIIIIVPTIIGMIFFREKAYYTIAGTVLGFYIGYILESKYVQYEVRNTIIKQLMKLVFGLGILMMLKSILKEMLPINIFSDFFRYIVIGLWITVGALCVFKRFAGHVKV